MANFNVSNYTDIKNAITSANQTTANDNLIFQNDITLTAAEVIDLQNIPASAGAGTLRFRSQQPTPAPAEPVMFTLTVTSALNITDNTPLTAQPAFTIGPFRLQIGDGTTNGSLSGNLRADDGGVLIFNNTTDTTYTGTFSVEEEDNALLNNQAGTTVTLDGSAGTNGLAIRASQGTGNASEYELEIGGDGNGIISGIIGDSGMVASPGDLEKTGDGSWTFSGANTYVGTTTVEEGTLIIRNSSGLGSTMGGTVVEDDATLSLEAPDGGGNLTIGAEALTISGEGAPGDDPGESAAGALSNELGDNTFAGNITLADSATIKSEAGSLTLTGTIDGAGVDGDGNPATQDLTLDGDANGVVSGNIGANVGSVTKEGDGTWVLNGTNTYVGGTLLIEGTLELGTLMSAGTGDITFDEDEQTLQIDVSGTLGNEIEDFGEGDVIDLTQISFDGATLTMNGDLLTVTEAADSGTDSTTLDIGDAPAGFKYVLASDGNGGTTITLVEAGVPDAPSKPTLVTDTGASSTDGITNAKTLTFVGTAQAGTTVTLYEGTTALGSGVATTSGTYTITLKAKSGGLGALTDGTHALTATATGEPGDTSGPSPTTTIVVDTAAPAAPAKPTLATASDSGVAGDGVTNSTTPTFTGTAEAGSTIKLFSGTVLVGTAIAGSNGTYTVTSAALADGVRVMKVTATDVAGNVSLASATLSLTIDTKAPVAPLAPTLAAGSDTGSSKTDGITNVATPTLTGKAEAGSTVNLYDTNGTTLLGTAVASTAGVYTITSASLATGAHSLKVTATDKAGNTSALSSGKTVTVDTSTPVAPSGPRLTAASDTGASTIDGITRDTTPTVTGAAEAGATVTLLDGAKVVGSAAANASGIYIITSTALANGSHSLTATATDAAGNVSAASAAKTVVIDTIAPGIPTVALANDTGLSATDRITNDPTLAVTVEPGSTAIYSTGNGFTAVAPNFATDGSDDGAHTVYVRAVDAAGNVSANYKSLSFTLDTKAPTVAINGVGGDVSQANQTITGTGEAGTIVRVYNGDDLVGSATVASNGKWSKAITLSEGENDISATDIDKAGNMGTSQTVEYDYTPAMASLNRMVQAMSTMSGSSSSMISPQAASAGAEAHPLAAAH